MRLDPWITAAGLSLGLSLSLGTGCGDKDLDDTGDGGGTGGGAADDSGTTGTDDTGGSGTDDTGSTGLPDPFSTCSEDDGAHTTINGITVGGDTLTVSLSYSGGCEDHDFVLCWPDQSFMESEPVQAGLELFHESYGDICEAYPTEEREFDLTPLRDAWQAAYGAGSGEIILRLGGESVTYSF